MSSTSLIEIARSRFLDVIRRVQPTRKWKLLIVDDYVQKLMSATLKQNDILHENVTVIENINRNREQQSLDAIYIVMPTTQNIDRIISDFAGNRNQYSAAHLFFVDRLPDELAQSLVQSPADPYIKTLEDLFINFWPLESQVFSVKNPASFFYMFSPLPNPTLAKAARARLEEELLLISKSIFNICVTLGENPYIRYYCPSHHSPLGSLAPPPLITASETQVPSRWRTNLARGPEYREHEVLESNHLSRVIAFMVQSELDQYKKVNPDFGRVREGKTRGTLIITDRSMDTIAPFLHEFTYQAMCNDLLPIDDGTKYTYKFQSSLGEYEDKVAMLSDADNVWTTVRHMHMRETIDKLMADFNKFLQESAGFKGEGAATLSDMKDMLADLPQYQEQREKFSLHLNMAQECMNIFEKTNLTNPAHVEQCCATGLTPEGKIPKNIVEEMVPLLDSKEMSNSAKARIIALYIQYRDGVPEEDKRRLFQHARLPIADQDAVNSLAHLGARLTRASGDRDTKKRLKPKKSSSDGEYELSRYQPLLRTVIEDHCANKLDTSVFPYAKDTPASATIARASPAPPQTTSLRSAKATWHKAPSAASRSTEAKPRMIVFMAGGMTYSEMRTCYECSNTLNQDAYIGSTHILTPKHFIEDLRVLEISGVGSRALPKGFQHTGPDHTRPFQALYDQRYAPQSQTPSAPPRMDRIQSAPGGRNPPQQMGQSLAPPRDPAASNKLRPPSAASYQSSSSMRSSGGNYSSSGTVSADDKKKSKKFFGRF